MATKPAPKTTASKKRPATAVPDTIDISEYENEDELVDDPDFEDESDEYNEPVNEIPEAGPKRAGNRAQRRAAARKRTTSDVDPAEREANGITVVAVDYDGERYWVPSDPTEWDVNATRAFEDGKAITALEYILEPDEDDRSGYDLLMSKRYRMKQINELFQKIAEVGGFETAGN